MSIIKKLNLPVDENILNTCKSIHFIGIGGIGMSGLAEILLTKGYKISGSDVKDTPITERLQRLGAKFFFNHAAKNLTSKPDLVVVSTAIIETNVEYKQAKKLGLKIIPRAKMLAILMNHQSGIAISGTHGKTTTTNMLAHILASAGLDPTYIIGGLVNKIGTNAHLGQSEYLIAEADESDGSFLMLKPRMAIVTNIDRDHVWFYDNDINNLTLAFKQFINHIPAGGCVVVCLDDENIAAMLPSLTVPVITYGFAKLADFRISQYQQTGLKTHFKVHYLDQELTVELNAPGKHNVLNAVATIAMAIQLNISTKAIQTALKEFSGTGRRFQLLGQVNHTHKNILVVDDYGHHPCEVAATLEAARSAWPDRRIVLAFQPHRYSRTQQSFDDFIKVLATADKLILLDVYAAGEKPIKNINSATMCSEIKQRYQIDAIHLKRDQNINDLIESDLQNNDILIMQGAGSISTMAHALITQPHESSRKSANE
ncbi:MAG: UDP-N-acetylmuramate--L-alanine ligase [Pseudomonadota bacterium]